MQMYLPLMGKIITGMGAAGLLTKKWPNASL